VHRRRVELKEAVVVQRVAGGDGARWTGVRRLALARREEKQRRGMSEGRGRKEGARRRGAPFIAARGSG
jgi:hypothetical protein